MSKSKKRNISECDNFSLYDEVTKFYKCNDINILLSSVEQWDIDTPNQSNQYKQTKQFKCLVCFFQTNSFNCWKLHIMSINHLLKCDKIKDLYSYIKYNQKSKVLLYGPKESLGINTTKYLKSGNITGVPMLMAEVMKRFITKQNGKMYYCSHCKKYAEKPIHSDTKKLNTKIKRPVEYYCKYCRVHFYSCPEMLDYHSLSVEHMTLKCYDKFCHEGKMDFKKMKTSVLLNENKEENLLPNVKRKCVANSIPLSNGVQDISSFKNIDCIEVTNERRQNFLINKSSSNEDFGCIILSDQKSQELNPVNSKTYPNEITDERSNLDVTTVSGETSSDNVTNLENEKVHKLDEDQEYGKYVTQRLKNIKNSTVKQNIKLEIDYLFYIQIKKMLQKNE